MEPDAGSSPSPYYKNVIIISADYELLYLKFDICYGLAMPGV